MTGMQAKNSTDSNTSSTVVAQVELSDSAITIPVPEDNNIAAGLFLRVARKIDSSHSFVLKKFNKYYGEESITVMSCDAHEPTIDDPIYKMKKYDLGADVYPASVNPARIMAWEDAKVMYHSKLYETFGYIAKVYSKTDISTPKELYYSAASDLRKMEEKVSIEVQAVDLSYIDDSIRPFRLLDLVHVVSLPHSVDTYLPILGIELPLGEPEKAVYTLKNETSLYSGSPSYISQYMAETYKKV